MMKLLGVSTTSRNGRPHETLKLEPEEPSMCFVYAIVYGKVTLTILDIVSSWWNIIYVAGLNSALFAKARVPNLGRSHDVPPVQRN